MREHRPRLQPPSMPEGATRRNLRHHPSAMPCLSGARSPAWRPCNRQPCLWRHSCPIVPRLRCLSGDSMLLRLLRATVFGLLAACVSLGATNPCAYAAEPIKVTIIHFNDVSDFAPANGNGGLAYAATQIQQWRARNINTIVTFGGNLLSPSPMSALTRGNQMIDMLNSIGVDYAAPGRHDFDFG